MEKEMWRPVKGYEGLYEASNLGRVRRVDRVRKMRRVNGKDVYATVKGTVLKPCFDGRRQYVHVNLWKDGVQKTKNIHRIVATAFIPNPDNLPEINHIDEDKTNNAVSNLEWCDHLYNNRYGSKLTASCGEKNAMNKFSVDVIRAIREEYDPNSPVGTLTELSRKYGVSVPHVKSIVTGKRWGWIE